MDDEMEGNCRHDVRGTGRRDHRSSRLARSVGKALFRGGFLLALIVPTVAQDPPRKKPVLIRADKTLEPEAEVETITPNPVEASHHQKVGDFYFRRKNYKAAAERYRDAVLYDPKSPERVQKLVRALEKLKLFGEAAQAYQDYLDRNPGSPQEDDFRKRARKLEEKGQGESP